MSLKKIIRKNKNTVRKYGGLKEPSWAESIAALYIVFLGFTIPSNYYKLTFILNGLSSFLAHSPAIEKYTEFQKNINFLDSITIYWPLFSETFFNILKISDRNRSIILLSVCISNYLVNNNFEKKLSSEISIIISVTLLSLNTFKNWDLEFLILIISGILTKILEERVIFEIGDEKVRVHTLWHIIGANMFKKITEL